MTSHARTPKVSAPVTRIDRSADGTVQSLTRAMQLLELLAEDDEGFRLVDIAAHSGLSTTTVHRLLTTLEQRQFVQFDRESSLWYVGVRSFSVGAAFARRRRIATLALPAMRRLRDLTGETVNLGVPDGGEIVFVTQVESREMVRAMARPGFRASLHCTAMGQALLARSDDAEVAQFLRTYGLPKSTCNTIARASRLNDTLAEVRRVGYAIDDEHNMVGLRCIAAAIGDEYQQPVAAISLVGPTLRIKTTDFARLGEAVLDAAQEASLAFGGSGFHAKNHATC